MISIFALSLAFVADPDFEPVQPTISDAVTELSAQRSTMSDAQWIARLDALGEAGDYSAWELIGEILSQGDGDIARDPERACDYFERIGSNRGDALHSAASCYWIGEGRPQDYVRARALYAQAIEAGYVTSLCGLGTMLVRGQGGPVDVEEGVSLCALATEFGDIDAMTDLGTFYLMGEGVERDPVAAREWLAPAAEEGQANAAHLMGQMLTRGDGVTADHAEAARYFLIAHNAGRPDSSWELARSLTRIGYIPEGDDIRIQPEILREAQGWAMDAAQRHPDSNIRESAQELARSLGALLEAAETP